MVFPRDLDGIWAVFLAWPWAILQPLSMTTIALTKFPSPWHWWALCSVCQTCLLLSFFWYLFFSFSLFLPGESTHKAACYMVTGGDAWIHVHHPYIYDSFQNLHVMVTANPGSDNSASSRYYRTHWIPLHCVKEDCKYIICCDGR